MPDFPIIDTHLHVWDPKKLNYPWLSSVPFLNKPYLMADYNKACGKVKVEKLVFLQCEVDPKQYVQEAEWVASLAKEDPRIEGIVPWAPIEKGAAAEAELAALAKNKLIKGVRRIIQSESVDFHVQPKFIEGLKLLPKHGLTFDICIFHPQMENTVKMVRQCPEVTFILDHIGKPGIKDHIMEPWAKHLKELAKMPNVWCKVSGMTTEADFKKWTEAELRPYFDTVFDAFGFDRTIYGGDWPVSYQAVELHRWVDVVDRAVENATPAEKKKLFRDNAVKFYRLGK